MTERINTYIPIPVHFNGGPMDGLPLQLTSPLDPAGNGPTVRGAVLSYNLNGSWHVYQLRTLAHDPYQEMSYVGERETPPLG